MDAPGAMDPVSKPPVELDTVWATWSRFTTVTVAPGVTLRCDGTNMKLVMAMEAFAPAWTVLPPVVAGADAGPELHPANAMTRPSTMPAATRRTDRPEPGPCGGWLPASCSV